MGPGKGKGKKGRAKGGKDGGKGGGGKGGAGKGAGKNVTFSTKKLTSKVASLVKKTLLDQGKNDEDEKGSLNEVASVLAAMSASSKSDANAGGKAVSDNYLDMATAVKINKIIKKVSPEGLSNPH